LPADVRSKREAWRARAYYASQCFSLFLGGWNDAATVSFHAPSTLLMLITFGAQGPLLPVFQKYYNVSLATLRAEWLTVMQINFTVVSLLFIASTVGFVLAGLVLNIPAVERLAFGKVMLICRSSDHCYSSEIAKDHP
jgi:hypothetical protein